MKKRIFIFSIIALILQICAFAQAGSILLVENEGVKAEQMNIMLLNESGKIKLADNGMNPVWSPDKTKIAFLTSDRNGERTELSVINYDRSDRMSLTKKLSESFFIILPTWFPDGKKIAYIFNTGTVQQVKKSELQVVDIHNQRVITLLSKEGATISDIAVSHKGDKIAYVLDYSPAKEIFILDTQKNKTITVKSGGVRDILPMWTADDKAIFFCSTKNLELLLKDPSKATYDILAAESSSGKVTNVVQNIYLSPLFPMFPFLSPDDEKVMYFADLADMQQGSLTLKDLRTNRAWKLTLEHLMMFGNILWSRDGKNILYITAEESQGLLIKQLDISKMKVVQSNRYEINPQLFAMQMFTPLKFIDW